MPDLFPRTTVGGVSVSRLIIGTNWFLGYSHTSAAKDQFIKSYQTRESIADILEVFLELRRRHRDGAGAPAADRGACRRPSSAPAARSS